MVIRRMRTVKTLLLVFGVLLLVACDDNLENDSDTPVENEINSSEEVDLSDGLPKHMKISQEFDMHADFNLPEDLRELEENAEEIVKVSPIEIIELGKYINSKEFYDSTLTEVEILETYSGGLKEGQTVTVSEPYYLYNNEVETIENYVPMDMKSDYILFLYKNNSGTYTISSLGYGKYNLNISSISEKPIQTFNTVNEIMEFGFIAENDEEAIHYNELRNEVISKYAN